MCDESHTNDRVKFIAWWQSRDRKYAHDVAQVHYNCGCDRYVTDVDFVPNIAALVWKHEIDRQMFNDLRIL